MSEIYRHVKRGTEYEVLFEAMVQDAADLGVVEGDIVVVYRGTDGQAWARKFNEFHDGRFELVRSGTPPKLSDHEVQFMQRLMDRYGEDGNLVDLNDWPGFMAIVNRYYTPVGDAK